MPSGCFVYAYIFSLITSQNLSSTNYGTGERALGDVTPAGLEVPNLSGKNAVIMWCDNC